MQVPYGTYCMKRWNRFDSAEKETKLTDKEIVAAIGWLAREGKVQSEETKKGRKTVELFSLAD